MTQSLPPMTAPTLALELRETIARWFSARRGMPSSEQILSALADLAAEQIAANPTPERRTRHLSNFIANSFVPTPPPFASVSAARPPSSF